MERNGGSKKAIIIGISDYDLLQPLNFCKTDGIKMHELLRSLGYEILENHKLIGRVNRDDLRNAIIEFFRNRNVKLKDTLLFYYSGHGVLDAYGDHYLAPSALNPFEPDTNGYPFDDLTKMIRKSISQKIVTILDCCYSGAATLGKGGVEDAANAGRKAIKDVCVDRIQYDLTDTLFDRKPGSPYYDVPKSPYYDKYYGYVCRALARIFLHSDIREYDSLWYNSHHLQDMIRSAINDDEPPPDSSRTVEDITKGIFVQCTSYHADVLVKHWLSSEEMIFRKIGAYALGKTRISRAVPRLIKILNNKAEHVEVLDEVSTALGSIGGISAVKALLYHRRIGAVGYALGELDDFKLYDDFLQRYLQSLKDSNDVEDSAVKGRETELLVYRAIGLKKDKRYIGMLRQLLYDSWPGFRGVAALALARINGSEELATLTKSYEESGSPIESIMTGLSLLLIRSPESDNILGHLRKDLAIDSQTYEPYLSDWRFRADILSILRNTRKPLATLIANSWELVYPHY